MTFTSQHSPTQCAAPSLASSWWPTLFSRYGRTRYIMQNSRILARWSLGKYLHFAYLFENLDFGSSKVQMNNLPREWSDVMHSLGGTALRESTEHCGLTRGLLRANYSISQKKLPPSLSPVALSFLSVSLSVPPMGVPIAESRTNAARGIRFCIRQSSSCLSVSFGHNSFYGFSLSAPCSLFPLSSCCLFEQSDSALLRLLENALPLLY